MKKNNTHHQTSRTEGRGGGGGEWYWEGNWAACLSISIIRSEVREGILIQDPHIKENTDSILGTLSSECTGTAKHSDGLLW